MYRWLLAALCLGLVWRQARAAENLRPAQVDAGAGWLIHVDVRAVLASDIGRELRTLDGEHPEWPADFRAQTGINLFEQVAAVTLYGLELGGGGVALVRGSFDAARAAESLRSQPGYAAGEHDGSVVHHWTFKGRRGCGAFERPDLLVLAEEPAQLGLALDVLRRKRRALPADSGLARSCRGASGEFLWAQIDNVKVPIGQLAPGAADTNSAASVGLVAGERGGELQAYLSVTPPSPEEAVRLEGFLRGLIAMVMMSPQQDPRLVNLARSVQVKTEGGRVRLSLEMKSSEAAGLARAAAAQKHAPSAPGFAPDAEQKSAAPGIMGAAP